MSRVVSRNTPDGTCVVNRDDFLKSFEDVPSTALNSLSDVRTQVDQCIAILSKVQNDCQKRMNQLKLIRSIVIHGEDVIGKEQLISQLIRLSNCLQLSVKDLRSEILREAAITCSFLCERYGNDVHQIAERCLPTAFSQLSVSTKIMATSGATLTLFICQYVRTKQIFTCIASYATSKDKSQRQQVAALLEVVIEHWSEKLKKSFMPQICELIKGAIRDADPETRSAGIKAFSKLESMHSEDADKLYASVDASKQKILRATDAASSSTSIASERGTTPFRSKLSATATRPMTSRIMSKVDTSSGGSKFARPTLGTLGSRTSSNIRPRGIAPTSQPGSRNVSLLRRPSVILPAEMQRIKINLGAGCFVSSLASEEAEKLQKAMNTATEFLGQPSVTDDEFLLPKRHGHNQHTMSSEVNSSGEDTCVRAIISNTAAQIEDFVVSRNMEMSAQKSPIGIRSPNLKRSQPLRLLTSELNTENRRVEINFNESFDILKMDSTTLLIDDVAEQSKYVSSKLEQISGYSVEQQFEGLVCIQTMLCEGSFTHWEQNFAKLLIAVFDVLSKSESDANKEVALRVLTKMCISQASRLFASTEMAVCKVLDAAVNSKDETMNVTADDCLKTLATHLPLAKIVKISQLILNEEKTPEAKASLVLKMVTYLFESLQVDELTPVIDDLAPCAIRAYDYPSSGVRKTAVHCLVAMVNRMGMNVMEPHLRKLSATKMNLVQVYVNRATSSSSHSHV